MRTIELVKGVKSSALGFGCAAICGSEGEERSQIAVRAALDHGINHFDVAPSYGYGAAEAFLARNLPSNRDNYVIATKFGISPSPLCRCLQPFKGFGRLLNSGMHSAPLEGSIQSRSRRSSRGLKLQLKSFIGSALFSRNVPTPSLLTKSFERSLTQLRVEYIDYLMIHEPASAVIGLDRILLEVDKLKTSGRLLGFGLAIGYDTLCIHENYLSEFDFIQMPGSPLQPAYKRIRDTRGHKSNVLYSVFQGCDNLGVYSHNNILARLREELPSSVVVCSMYNPEHIKNNIEVFC